MPEGFAKRHISDAENRLRLLLCIDALGLCTREELWPFVAKLELMEYMPMCLYLDELLRDGSLMEGQHAVQGVLFLTGGDGRHWNCSSGGCPAATATAFCWPRPSTPPS